MVILVKRGRSEVEVVLLLLLMMKMEMVVERLQELSPERSSERLLEWQWLRKRGEG